MATLTPISHTPPPIPALALWQKNMLTLGAKWADWTAKNPCQFGVETQPWYYDGARVFQQIADYTKDAKWLVTADSLLSQYEAYYTGIAKTQNIGVGWRMFPRGVYMAWLRTGDPKHKAFIDMLMHQQAYIVEGLRYLRKDWPHYDATTTREAAYMLDIFVVSELMGNPRSPLLSVAVQHCVMAQLTDFMTPGSASYHGQTNTGYGLSVGSYVNNFMVGLALESLIHYYEMTVSEGKPDVAIPPFIKTVLDDFWAHCVEPFSHAQYYNSDPINGHKSLITGKQIPEHFTASSLNQLVSPAFAWYWKFSGNPTYLALGDLLFAAGVNGAVGDASADSKQGADYSFDGKQFNQNYKWSFDYVKWRS